jgi:hypothetical protein
MGFQYACRAFLSTENLVGDIVADNRVEVVVRSNPVGKDYTDTLSEASWDKSDCPQKSVCWH